MKAMPEKQVSRAFPLTPFKFSLTGAWLPKLGRYLFQG